MDQEGLDSIVARLRHQGRDDAQTEVKASATSLSRDVWDSVSAFANTLGGTIILGLDEDGFVPVQGFALHRVLDQLVDGFGQSNATGGRVTNPPTFDISQLVPVDQSMVSDERVKQGGRFQGQRRVCVLAENRCLRPMRSRVE